MLKRLPTDLLNKLRNANLTENITMQEVAKIPAEVFRILKVNYCCLILLIIVEMNFVLFTS